MLSGALRLLGLGLSEGTVLSVFVIEPVGGCCAFC